MNCLCCIFSQLSQYWAVYAPVNAYCSSELIFIIVMPKNTVSILYFKNWFQTEQRKHIIMNFKIVAPVICCQNSVFCVDCQIPRGIFVCLNVESARRHSWLQFPCWGASEFHYPGPMDAPTVGSYRAFSAMSALGLADGLGPLFNLERRYRYHDMQTAKINLNGIKF